MAEKRRGLGRGLGALIPTSDPATSDASQPVDVFFPPKGSDSTQPVSTVLGGAGVKPRDPLVPNTSHVAALTGAIAETAPAAGTTTLAAEAPAQTAEAPDGTAAAPARTAEVPSTETGNQAATSSGTSGTDEATSGAASASGATGNQATQASDVAAAAMSGGSSEVDEGLVPVPGARFAELPVDAIVPNHRQPRQVFDDDDLSELAGSIKEVGVLQPVVVRAIDDGQYELIMGERRWRATQEAGISSIPAIIRETDETDLLRDALLENLHRAQLNPLEEAAAYQQLLDDFACTHEELASRIARSRPQISNTLRLLKLPPLVQRRVAAGVLSAGHARALLGLPDGAAMERLAQRIVAEGLSVRATEEIVALGGDREPEPKRQQPRAGQRNPAMEDLASRLSDRFETRVKVALGKSKGRLTVEFASVQDLNRILQVLAPEDPGVFKETVDNKEDPAPSR